MIGELRAVRRFPVTAKNEFCAGRSIRKECLRRARKAKDDHVAALGAHRPDIDLTGIDRPIDKVRRRTQAHRPYNRLFKCSAHRAPVPG